MHGNVWEWVHDWKAIILVAQTDPRVQHRARVGSYGVVPGSVAGRTCVQLSGKAKPPIDTIPLHSHDYRLPPRFPIHASRYGKSRTGIVRGSRHHREAGHAWAEPGVEAHDARDGNITDQIVVTGTVDMNSTGTYLLTYIRTDGGGNTATTTRTVTVVGNRTVDLNATVAMDMIWCPPGTFTMGSPLDEANREDDENQTQCNSYKKASI